MSVRITTKELVHEVRTAAKVWAHIIDHMVETRADRNWEREGALQTIQRNLTGDLAEIGKLVAAGNLKEANDQVGLLMLRCDVTLQSAPIRADQESREAAHAGGA